jgi:predicted PurR-regulated permease PerM
MTSGQRQQAIFWLAALAVLFLAIHLLSSILLPFVAIAYLLDPAVDRLERWHLPRGLATLVALMAFMLALVLVAMLLVPLLEVQIGEIARRAPGLVETGRREIQRLVELAQERLAPEDIAKLREMAGSWAASVVAWAIGFVEGLLTSGIALANLLSLVFITPVVSFFLLRDWDRILAAIDRWLPRHHAATIREQAHLVDATLAGFIHGQLLVSALLGIYYAAALTIAGLNFGVVIGVLIGFLSVIPFVGVTLGLVLSLGLALVQFGVAHWINIAVIGAIFAVGQTAEGNWLQPKLVGERVNLHPVWVMFALLAFGTLFGFIGLLLALPAAAVAGVLVRFAMSRYMASSLYDPANRPTPRD